MNIGFDADEAGRLSCDRALEALSAWEMRQRIVPVMKQ